MKGAYWAGDTEVEDLAAVIRLLAAHVPNSAPPKTFGLTRRELEVVAGIVSRYSNREIADKLSISEYTVKHRVTNIFDKAGVSNRLELALFVMRHRSLS